MALLKKLIFTVIALLVLGILALWIFIQMIKPQAINDLVKEQLQAITHKPVTIQGAISWQLFPRPGLKLSKLQIGNPGDQQSDYSLSLDSLTFNLQMAPLMHGHFVFSEIGVDGLDAVIHAKAFNKAAKPNLPQSSQLTDSRFNYFAIAQLNLSHSRIQWLDQNQSILLNDVKLSLEELNFNKKAFPLQIKAQIQASNKSSYTLSTQLNFKGRLILDQQMLQQPTVFYPHAKIAGQLLLQNSRYNQVNIAKINANLKSLSDQIVLNPLTLNLYNGQSIGELHYFPGKNQISIAQTGTNLNSDSFFHDLTGKNLVRGNLDYALSMQFPLTQSWLSALSGQGNLAIKDGKLLIVDLNALLKESDDKLSGLLKSQKKDPDTQKLQFSDQDINQYTQGTTPFKLTSLRFSIQQGELKAEQLLLQTNTVEIKGDGLLNLQTYALNSRLQAHLDSDMPQFPIIKNMFAGDFPIIITGSLYKPVVTPDISLINPILARILINSTVGKPIKFIGNRLKAIIE